ANGRRGRPRSTVTAGDVGRRAGRRRYAEALPRPRHRPGELSGAPSQGGRSSADLGPGRQAQAAIGSVRMTQIVRAVSPQVPEPPVGTWASCLVVNGVAYLAGMTAGGAEGDEYAQGKVIFTKIRNLLEAAGGSMADVVKVTIFVTDITQREKVWKARQEFFTGNFPASTLVQVAALANPSLKVEIEAVAHIGASKS